MITSIDQLKAWLADGKYVKVRKGVMDYTLADDEGNVVSYYPDTKSAYVTLRVVPSKSTIEAIEDKARCVEIADLQNRLNELQTKLNKVQAL